MSSNATNHVSYNFKHQRSINNLPDEQQIQYRIHKYQLELYRQSSIKSSKLVNKNDLHTKINRFYSKLLVDYHWVFLVVGVTISVILTGFSFTKLPLPNLLDPTRGFSARGEGTLTSQLIVMKNIGNEITKYQKEILNIYDNIKSRRQNQTDSDFGIDFGNDNNYNNHNSNNNNLPDYGLDENVADQANKREAQKNNKNNDAVEEKNFKDEFDTDIDTDTDNHTETDTGTGTEDESSKRHSEFAKRLKRQTADEQWQQSEIYLDMNIWNQFTGHDLLNMLPGDLHVEEDHAHAINQVLNCNYTLALDQSFEFYFSSDEELSSKKLFDRFFGNYSHQASFSSTSSYSPSTSSSFSSSFSSSATGIRRIKQVKSNLLHLKKLKSLCKYDRQFVDMFAEWNGMRSSQVCYFSLPLAIATLNNKTDCAELTQTDVDAFLELLDSCYPLHASGILYATAEENKKKPEIMELLTKNNPLSKFARFEVVRNNVCFKKNIMHVVYEHLIDKDFVAAFADKRKDPAEFEVKISSLLVFNTNDRVPSMANRTNTRLMSQSSVYQFYVKYFHSKTYQDDETQVLGINFIGIRIETAMRMISQEMLLVALAISLIVIVTLLYLKSIFISIIVNLGVGMSVGISFFAYRIVFDIDFFPFMNMFAAFLLIGIACDNVYVLFDAWYNEKTRIIMEDLSEMIEKYYNSDDRSEPLLASEPQPTVANGDLSIADQTVPSPTGNKPSPPSSSQSPNEQILPPIFIKKRLFKSSSSSKNKRASTRSSNSQNGNSKGNDLQKTAGGKANTAGTETTEKDLFLTAVEKRATGSESETNSNPLGNSPIYTDLLEKGINIADYELNPLYVRLAPLSDEQMVRVMSGTLRHAATSIFVTSFTTAAAFLTNYITKLPCVQLFGVFTGFCILIYFIIVITMVAAFVITYEKFIQPFSCKWQPGVMKSLENAFENVMGYFSLLNHQIISKFLPAMVIKLRVFFFVLFLALGLVGMFVVFYKPQLKPPQTWRHQFFERNNPMERFEFNIKDQFLAYFNDDKRNLTNPEIFFVFGIMNKDTGRVFNPDDDGYLVYDKKFDFISEESQLWINHFINVSIRTRPDLFLVDEIVTEWNDYLRNMQWFCSDIMGLQDKDVHKKIYLPYKRDILVRCRNEINQMLVSSNLETFESLMASFPRRIIFMTNNSDVNGLLLRVNANRTFNDYDAVNEYYQEIKAFHALHFPNATTGFSNGWFISVAFALYDLQYELITGTYSSLVASMLIALFILLLTSGNIFISIFAIITISFSIADTIAIFVFMGWNLSILESLVIIMSVGLSVDFSCHYGVAYINSDREFNYENNYCCRRTGSGDIKNALNSDKSSSSLELKPHSNRSELKAFRANTAAAQKKRCKCLHTLWRQYERNNKERFVRIHDIFDRVGSAVLMAALTTFLAGLSMYPSGLTSFTKMSQFLMLVMCTSYLYATFFFVPMCALFGPTRDFGNLNFREWFGYIISIFRKKKSTQRQRGEEEKKSRDKKILPNTSSC